jgi:protein-S-isoprenylcysteine O-methyltransferase Ste14
MLTRLFAAIRGFIYATAFVFTWWWIVAFMRPLDVRFSFSIPEWLRIPGSVIAIFGALIAFSCISVFAFFGKGTPAPFDAPREFVAVGPYKYVRNPMYLGAVLVIVGAAFILRSPSALGVAVFFIVLMHIFVLVYEEPTLEHKFGNSYLAYKARVHRWLPIWHDNTET